MAWNPAPVVAIVLGVVALILWLVLAPPARSARGILRGAAVVLLALALLDVGCEGADVAARARLVVLVDRSLSMEATGRLRGAEAWAERLEDLPGWRVEREAFGGATTDLAAAIARAEARLPDAIVIVSDGRAAGGRAAEPPGVPLHVHAPEPIAVQDLAIADVVVEEREGGDGLALVEIAAVGGRGAPARAIEVLVNGRRAGSAWTGAPLAAGERRTARIQLPPVPARAVVEARLAGSDIVPGNDRRARVVGPGPGPRGTLLAGLRPAWEMGFVRRELEAAGQGPVDVVWATAAGRLAPLDRGGASSWSQLDADRYRSAWLFGDPALLGQAGRAWIERFVGRGGRGLAWLPAGYAGALVGTGATAPGSARASGPPSITEAGMRWLTVVGGPLESAPAGEAMWPPLELLPAAASLPAGASALLTVGERPVAWTLERGTSRAVVLLGTGYYRWRLVPEETPRVFWEGWIDALARWLTGAAAADRPLVQMPSGGRIADGDTLVAPVTADETIAWRIEDGDGGVLARGTVESGADPRELRAGPFAPGVYGLVVETEDTRSRRVVEPFVVESWAPDLAWTAADTTSLAQAARASGGTVVGTEPSIPPPARSAAPSASAGHAFGLGTTPWAYFLVAILLLVDWATATFRARRAMARPQSAD